MGIKGHIEVTSKVTSRSQARSHQGHKQGQDVLIQLETGQTAPVV